MWKRDPDLMPDGYERERQAAWKWFGITLAALLSLIGIWVLSHMRPDVVEDVIGGAAVLAFIFLMIIAQELWRLRR